MLEELARDVTGWPAHAVEFFELLGWTQHLEHFRPQACWFDVRSLERDERVDGAFDEASHTVDVAPISTFDGWHSIKNIGFFLWRLVPNRALRRRPAVLDDAVGLLLQPARQPRAALHASAPRGRGDAACRPSCTCPSRSDARSSGSTSRSTRGLPPPDFTEPLRTAERSRSARRRRT